jgi:hypothetical protein
MTGQSRTIPWPNPVSPDHLLVRLTSCVHAMRVCIAAREKMYLRCTIHTCGRPKHEECMAEPIHNISSTELHEGHRTGVGEDQGLLFSVSVGG